ncbi:MAG: hypothetical protein LC798_05920 [Chloroflexi bacterium]|nr:hypothetical protein [Chloroflexota bacterium]
MLVAGVTLLALGEVASPPIVDARVARLLALREVTAMILLASVAVLFLAFREGAALVVITMVVIGAVRLIVMVIVVGLLAHARVSQQGLCVPLWTAGQAPAYEISARRRGS